ncbi:MAG: hypothetical protein F4066_02155 [Chloroflexi bacterium]|nr:hypothetical protein [Chloroflexota bacterium]
MNTAAFPSARTHVLSRGGAGRGLAHGLLLALSIFLLDAAMSSAQSSVTLVSNTGQALNDTSGGGAERAQSFRTGASAAGYKLTGVEVPFVTGEVPGAHSYAIRILSSNDGNPGSTLSTLTLSTVTSDGVASFSGSVDLEASTTYFVFYDAVVSSPGGRYRRTSSDNEDPGAAPGWSMGDGSRWRQAGTTPWNTSGTSWQIAIKGYDKAQPAAAVAPPIPPNMAYSPVQWHADDPLNTAARHAFPLSLAEIESNRTKDGSGSLDLSGIDASLAPERAERSRGYYLSNRVYSPAEQSALVEQAPGGGYRIVGPDETRYQVVRGSPLVLVKLWHVYLRDSGFNGIERLGGPWYPRRDHLLAEPVGLCLPAPDEDARIAVRIRGESAWTVLDTVERDGRLCADTVRVGWVIVVLKPEEAAA